MFRRYHYLNHDINKSARCWVATLNGDICAFTSVLPFVGRLKNTWRGHRTVVLPDFQGIGIGSILTDSVAQILMDEGKSYVTTTSNPKLIHARASSPKWQTYRFGRSGKHGITAKTAAAGRITASFRYIGESKPPE